ncbi:unnamed protein product [Clonostachys rosea]|uniref:Uncharacterized protein n=1 Tax=Bionectria ochroleuca TaxID=29856 RepID=A0ABY6UR52_BIOOC|nr:unnamed protein product [Clonostachys rosea]
MASKLRTKTKSANEKLDNFIQATPSGVPLATNQAEQNPRRALNSIRRHNYTVNTIENQDAKQRQAHDPREMEHWQRMYQLLDKAIDDRSSGESLQSQLLIEVQALSNMKKTKEG